MSADETIIPFRVSITPEERSAILACFDDIIGSGWFILGKYTERFEAQFAAATGTRYAVAVNSGSSALEIICRGFEVAGRDVLVPTNTNFATAMAAINAGARPVFYDSGLYPSVPALEAALTDRTAAVVIVHIGGYVTPEMTQIAALCRARGVRLIEDAAHALGARLGDAAVGSLGDAAAFSFYPTKVLSTGEGGMVTTDDDRLRDTARILRDQGKGSDSRYHVAQGNSWRMTEFGAAMGEILLRSLGRDVGYRRSLMEMYRAGLADSPGLDVAPVARTQTPNGYKQIAYLDAAVDRAVLTEALARRNVILARGIYEVPLHRQPVFRPYAGGSFPVGDAFSDRHVALPLWRHMPRHQVAATIEHIGAALGEWRTDVSGSLETVAP